MKVRIEFDVNTYEEVEKVELWLQALLWDVIFGGEVSCLHALRELHAKVREIGRYVAPPE